MTITPNFGAYSYWTFVPASRSNWYICEPTTMVLRICDICKTNFSAILYNSPYGMAVCTSCHMRFKPQVPKKPKPPSQTVDKMKVEYLLNPTKPERK